jgi:flagellar biosynthesis protein FlhF
MSEAMDRLKRELGREAIILEARTVHRRLGPGAPPQPIVQITAAQQADATSQSPASRSAAEVCRSYQTLIEQCVSEKLAKDLVERAQRTAASRPGTFDRELRSCLRELIAATLPPVQPIRLKAAKPTVVAFVGPTGVGKTTTVAKLAADFRLRQAKDVRLITLDSHRLGAMQQLQRYSEIMEVPFTAVSSADGLKSAIEHAQDADLVLMDTPGIPPRQSAALDALNKLLRHVAIDEVHLVLPATSSQPHLTTTVAAYERLGFNCVVLTKLDEGVGFGVLLGVFEKLHTPLSYITNGLTVPDDLHVLPAAILSRLILGEPAELPQE